MLGFVATAGHGGRQQSSASVNITARAWLCTSQEPSSYDQQLSTSLIQHLLTCYHPHGDYAFVQAERTTVYLSLWHGVDVGKY